MVLGELRQENEELKQENNKLIFNNSLLIKDNNELKRANEILLKAINEIKNNEIDLKILNECYYKIIDVRFNFNNDLNEIEQENKWIQLETEYKYIFRLCLFLLEQNEIITRKNPQTIY